MANMLKVEIHNLKGISYLAMNIPLSPNVYAITGLNGAGKSTLMMAISPRLKENISFANIKPAEYSGVTEIKYEIDGIFEKWVPRSGDWVISESNGHLVIRGFQEGSITRGTRFFNASRVGIQNLYPVSEVDLIEADLFIKDNLSYIIHGDRYHYRLLYRIDRTTAYQRYGYKGVPYFIKSEAGQFITHVELSTGEFLLINLLHLIFNLLIRTNNADHLNLILIDEVELALHPSAIKRLLEFSKEIAQRYQVAIYFATHSLEIIHNLPVSNLFYLQRQMNGNVICEYDCYPAYITRDIYTHDGYDFVILVEDDLAKFLVHKIIHNIQAENKKRIQILPAGGYSNTCDLHNNLLEDRMLAVTTKVISIIDGDVQQEAQSTIREKRQAGLWRALSDDSILFLPISSLEKYLKSELFDNRNIELARKLRDRFYKYEDSPIWFLQEYMQNIENKRQADVQRGIAPLEDKLYFRNGKNLFSILTNKVREYNLTEAMIRQQLCDFVLEGINVSSFELALNEIIR